MSDFVVPQRALDIACNAYEAQIQRVVDGEAGDCEEQVAVLAAAPLVAAAELRRLADRLYLMRRAATGKERADGLYDAWRLCLNRAAELDPPAEEVAS